LVATTHPYEREYHSKEDILAWARSNDWQKLEVLKSTDTVEFKAYFLDAFGKIKFTMNFLLLSLRMGAGFMWMVHSINQVLVYTMRYRYLLVLFPFFFSRFQAWSTGLFLY
jgi:hypothetical protein